MITKEQKDQWIKALRSGEYRQCRARLKNGGKHVSYCCLGVVRELYPKDANKKNADPGMLNPEFLPFDYQNKLVSLNDDGTPFPKIADWIETHDTEKFKAKGDT